MCCCSLLDVHLCRFKIALENVKASKEEIIRVQTRAYDTFRGNPRYADDERFIRMCLELVRSKSKCARVITHPEAD